MNKIKRFVLLISCLLLLNGCVKNNTTMKINKDKSMNLEVFILVKDEIKNKLSSDFNSSDLEKRGFKVTTTSDNNFSGYKITKSFDNIDDLSKNTNNKVVDISNILESDFDFTVLFNKKTNFFKDTYTANYTYSFSELKEKYNTIENETQDGNTQEDDYTETSDYTDEMELKYNLILPSKAKSNNANKKTNSGKSLEWNLSSTSESKISYSFDIYNYKNILLVGGGVALLIIIIIVVIVIIKKKKNSKGTLIYKEYDPSIEGELNKNEIINTPEVTNQQQGVNNVESNNQLSVSNEGPQVLETLEFSLPEEQPKKQTDIPVPENQFANNNAVTQNESSEIKLKTQNFNREPDFVRRNDTSKFINSGNQFDESDKDSLSQAMPNQSQALDVPNGIALSDLDDNK